MSRIDFDVLWLEQQIAELVRDFPELQEDEALKADVIEGQIDVEAVMARVVSHIMEADEMLDGIKPRAEALAERKKRWERRKDFLRSLAQRVLDASGRAKIELPEATVAKSPGRESVEVLDVNELPQGLYVTERKADKKAIAAQLKEGPVPGAKLVKGDDTVRISTK